MMSNKRAEQVATPWFLQKRFEALYIHEGNGRIVHINQWYGGQAPRFCLMRSSQTVVWRYRADVPAELCHELTQLCQDEPAELTRLPKHFEAYLELLGSHQPVTQHWSGPAYVCQPISQIDSNGSDDNTITVTTNNADLLKDYLNDWLEDVAHVQPFVAALANDKAVAVCSSVRKTDVLHEAGVETTSAYRRRGHATNVVVAWVKAVLELNALPLYSTSYENTASMGIASKLGFEQYAVDFHVS
ncbi:MAG: GNAT family N-acetyltransferase [Deinococcota bacterium]